MITQALVLSPYTGTTQGHSQILKCLVTAARSLFPMSTAYYTGFNEATIAALSKLELNDTLIIIDFPHTGYGHVLNEMLGRNSGKGNISTYLAMYTPPNLPDPVPDVDVIIEAEPGAYVGTPRVVLSLDAPLLASVPTGQPTREHVIARGDGPAVLACLTGNAEEREALYTTAAALSRAVSPHMKLVPSTGLPQPLVDNFPLYDRVFVTCGYSLAWEVATYLALTGQSRHKQLQWLRLERPVEDVQRRAELASSGRWPFRSPPRPGTLDGLRSLAFTLAQIVGRPAPTLLPMARELDWRAVSRRVIADIAATLPANAWPVKEVGSDGHAR